MSSLAGPVLLSSLIAYSLLLIYVQIQGQRVRAGRWWLSLTLLFALLSAVAYLAPNFNSLNGYLVTLAQVLLIVSFGALVIHDVTNRAPRAWLSIGVIWIGAVVVATLLGDPLTIGQPDWLVNAFNAPTALTAIIIVGLLIIGLALLATEFYAFYTAALPEVANRAFFWIIAATMLLVGSVLIISATEPLLWIGQVFVLIGVAGAVYAQLSYRVIDIRRELGSALRTFLLLIVTAALIFLALSAAERFEISGALALAVLALIAAFLYTPLRQLAEGAINLFLRGALTDPGEATRRYSQQVSGAVELPTLVEAATRSINSLMRVRRSALILVNDSDSSEEQVELQMLPGDAKPGHLTKEGLLYRKFASEGLCISQFDLEFDPTYKSLPESESTFFRETQMSAYAPIVSENVLIGILACGAKNNDAPFMMGDFELLTTMAHQTETVLRNARLLTDLRNLNEGMKTLNQSLEGAKEQVERLDSVKTDFITIASHELRTPLAQIRGYTDIIDALNESGMLDRDQMSGMVSNLRKATERMEELIGAMLDVSQLDVDAMDLRFAQTSLESVMRMAIEPMTDAVKQRKLTLSARGLRGLPSVQADMQRLVQAFRNIVVNAIKFTPDGGRIEIKAELQAAKQPGEQDHILVTISDTGVGIDKENLELIFRKFYRAYDPSLHSTGAYKFMGAGPGLGLTIAQGVVEGHGGKIWAESPGHNMESYPGTNFYVLLPVTPPEDARRVLPFEGQKPEPVSNEPTLMRTQL